MRSGRARSGGPGRAGRSPRGAGAARPPVPCVLSRSPGPPWREEEPSPGQERAPVPRPPADRGAAASLVQWFLTVQQFSIIIVKCLGPLDQRGPGIGPAAADERAPWRRRRPAAPGGTDGPGPRTELTPGAGGAAGPGRPRGRWGRTA